MYYVSYTEVRSCGRFTYSRRPLNNETIISKTVFDNTWPRIESMEDFFELLIPKGKSVLNEHIGGFN